MKILYVTTIVATMDFFPRHIEMLNEEGHTVEIASNTDGRIPQYCLDMNLKVYHIPFSRSPFSKSNLTAYKLLKKLIGEESYDIVHTHTPNASAIVRLVCKKLRKQGLKVFYTAHGFHFYRGAPLKNWLIYYPIEWLCANWTDKLITINKEDFVLAQKRMHAREVIYVPGVGIDLDKFSEVIANRNEKRKELGIPENATLLISVGELNDNKNHETVIKAIKDMDVYYIIAGIGDKKDYLQNLIDAQGMTNRIKLLGFRIDVKDLYSISEIFVFPSFREGLSVALMEAMASGLPCVVSRIRGNVDLIDENGGSLFDPYSVDSCKTAILSTIDMRSGYNEHNQAKVQQFSTNQILTHLYDLYR